MDSRNPITGEYVWSLGTLIWLPVLVVIVAALVVAAVWLHRHSWDELDRAPARLVKWSCVATAVIIMGVTASPAGMWPYDKEYHAWWTVHGTVTSVDKRLISDSDNGISERYVLGVAGQPFGVDDTRAATARVGDTVTLSCKREWQYAASSGWACRWQGLAR